MGGRSLELLYQPDSACGLRSPLVIAADCGGDLSQVALPLWGDGSRPVREPVSVHPGLSGGELRALPVVEYRCKPPPQQINARVGELAGDGRDYRQCAVLGIPHLPIALELLANLGEGVLGAPSVELVEHDDIGGIKHL